MFKDEHQFPTPAEATSEASQNALHGLLEATGIVPWEANAQNWQFTYVGPQAVKLLGYPIDRWYEKDFWTDHLYADDRARTIQYCMDHSQSDDQYQFDYRMQGADDRIVWIQDIVTVIRENGLPVLLRGFLIDVTSRKEVDEALRKSQERFMLAVHGSGIGIWDWDIQTNQVFLSPIWKRMLGYEDDEMKDSFEAWEGRLHPDDRDRVLTTMRKHLAGSLSEYEMEHRLRHKDGSYRWVLSRGVSLRDTSGKPTRFSGSHVDITRLKETREALEAVSGRLIVAQEDERARIARELHDDIGQRMALLGIHIERLSELVSPRSQESKRLVENLRTQTKDIASDIQHISYELHPAKLEHLGLIAAVKALCRDVSAHSPIRIDVQAPSVSGPIPRNVALCLYRVIQEALANVLKHSGSEEARVNISVNEDVIDVSICDSGVGFDDDSARATGRLGLASMHERLRLVRGELAIESHASQGTSIRMRVPLHG
jgi:PAS domain S-box-containing protein